MVVHTSAFGAPAFWTLHLFLVQVFMVVHISAFSYTFLWTLHLFLVQVLKVVRTRALVHMLMDMEILGEQGME